jgi:hypothetical protein
LQLFPEFKVLNDLKTSLFILLKSYCNLAQPWIDKKIKNSLTFGDVDFDKSDTEFGKISNYIIEGKTAKTSKSF